MNRTSFDTGDEGQPPGASCMAAQPAQPAQPARRRGRGLALVSMALLAGMVGALVWLAKPNLGSLYLLTETPAVQEQTAPAATATPPAPTAALPAAALPTGDALSVTPLPDVPRAPPTPDPSKLDLRALAATPTATPTRTPRPTRASVEGVVGRSGATLWSAAGLPVAELPQGALLAIQAQSADGAWLYATSQAGVSGWAASTDIIVFDTSRLGTEDVTIRPLTPTPAAAAAGLPSPTPGGASAPAAADPTQAAALTARVAVDDARLNIRSGPGADYPIVAKADPGAVLALRGRDASGAWLLVDAPDAAAGYGWVAAEFVETSAALDDLPARRAGEEEWMPSAPPADAADLGATKGGAPPAKTGMAHRVDYPVDDRPVDDRSAAVHLPVPTPTATGLQGKLVIQQTWGGAIYVYDFATGDLRLLTGGFDPALSPDGRTVAFTRDGGEHGLYLIDVDGANERRIFAGRAALRSPKFSPDGRYIVFERGDQVIDCRKSDSGCLPNTPGNDGLPRATEVQQKLARVDTNGQNYQDIAVLDRARAPDWQAEGIVYQSPGGIQITQDAPGVRSELVFLEIGKQYALDPDLQPGHGRVIFQQREASHWEIFGVDLDGGNLQGLTRPGFLLAETFPSNVAPAWSYDGRHIVFLSNRTEDQSAGAWAVWVMDAGGGNLQRLPIDLDFTYTYVSEQMLDWGP
jgi:hypothetical protein